MSYRFPWSDRVCCNNCKTKATRLAPENVLDKGTGAVLKAVVWVGRRAAVALTGTTGDAGGGRLVVVLAWVVFFSLASADL